MGVIVICPHAFDKALWGITVRSVALGFSFVGHT